jgi:hypothetical protein
VGKAHPSFARFLVDPMFSRRGGQIPIKFFRIFHFRRKSPWLKELKIQKDFDPEKEGRKIDILA